MWRMRRLVSSVKNGGNEILDILNHCHYASGMTMSITIPDPLLASTESLATRMKLSRSEIVALALAKFIREHQTDQLTSQIIKFIEENGQPEFDESMSRVGINVLKKAEW